MLPTLFVIPTRFFFAVLPLPLHRLLPRWGVRVSQVGGAFPCVNKIFLLFFFFVPVAEFDVMSVVLVDRRLAALSGGC